MQLKPLVEEKPIRFVLDERLDFNHRVPLRKSYIVASSYRSGSNYLCWELWRTSILGAPVEFLNPYDALPVLMNRFKAVSPADYISKLLAHRTSRNGVFGLKTHFHHFEAFLKQYPTLLDALAPVTFIHLSRRDKIAQAVSMAKALQTDFWTSRIQSERVPPQYDRELIAKCLDEIKLQDLNWPLWFEKHGITPFPVMYEDFVADPPGVVHSIQKLLGVEDDERAEVNVPPTKSQSDDTNRMWIERFRREMQVNSIHVASAAAAPEPKPAAVELPHPLDRYERFIKTLPAAPGSASGFVDAIRLRHRYGAIVARNRDLFQNARVLDIMGARGLWTLAALDAGAAHVVCMTSPESTEVAREGLQDYGFDPERHQVVNLADSQKFGPGSFDLILCGRYFERSDPRLFFADLHRLRPKHVILDIGVVRGGGPICRFALRSRNRSTINAPDRYSTIIGRPNHELIMFLCDLFEFRWRLIDWQAMGITNWTGIHDYARDERRTYVLDQMT
jgi:LPS sulfotransferase NodH